MPKKLSPEQFAQIKEFVNTFPEAEREAKMQEVLAELEEGAEKKQQCPFCLMVAGDLTTYKVFEDENLLAVLEINPANPGHILLFPKAHIGSLKEVKAEVVDALFRVAHVLSDILLTFADGANVLFAEGSAAGQRFPHYAVQVIPRFKGDSVQLVWQAKQLGEKELGALREKIMSAIQQLQAAQKEVKVDLSGVRERLTGQRKRRP